MAEEEGVRRYRGAALRIALWTLLSRLLGVVRDRLMYGFFGRGAELGAFHLAWAAPNLFRRLLGEGALTAAFVPVLTRRLQADGEAAARRGLGAILGALLLVLGGIVGVLGLLVALVPESWFGRYGGVLRWLLLVLLPYLVPVSLMAVAAGALNVRGRFAWPAAAPAVLNVVWIVALVVLERWGAGLPVETQAIVLAAAVLFGGSLQLVLQVPGLRRTGMLGRPRLDLADPDLRAVGRSMAPMVLGLSVVQLNTLMTQLVAAYLIPETGANSILFLANRMLEFPHALAGVALGTAVFPLLALLSARQDRGELTRTLDRALSLGVFFALPAAAGLAALAGPLIDVLFVTGNFSSTDGRETTIVLRVLALSLPGLVAVQVLARAHYALGDTRTPVRIAIWLFALSQVLNVGLGLWLGTTGLAWSSAVGATLNAALLLRSLRRGFGLAAFPRLASTSLRACLASAPTGGAALLAAIAADSWLAPGAGLAVRIAAELLLPGAAGLIVFFGVARVLGTEEVGELWRGIRRRATGGNRGAT